MVVKTKAYRFECLDETIVQLNKDNCLIVAGGTDVMVFYKNYRGLPAQIHQPVVFIDHHPELKQIYVKGRDIHIGAGCTYSEMLENPLIPFVFKQAIKVIAAPAIRNRGTIGGNVCNASPAGDALPLLYIYNAKLLLRSVNGEREVEISKFIQGPRRVQRFSNELLVEIILPNVLDAGARVVFEKVGNRSADAIAKVSFAGLMRVDKNRVKEARFAFGAVGPTIVRSHPIEQKLVGKVFPLDNGWIKGIVVDFARIINPIDDQRSTAAYRKRVALNLLRYFLGSSR